MTSLLFSVLLVLLVPPRFSSSSKQTKEDFEYDEYGVKYASPCEICKYSVAELDAKLAETGKNGEILQTSYHLDATKDVKKKEYKKSQVRLIESLETACEGILSYNVHKERKDSTRFAKGQSQTFKTLHGLVAKGVKVDLGIPHEMWDKPSAEITDLKSKCENFLERYESEIEEWYNDGEKEPLETFLCRGLVLKNSEDAKCLDERFLEADANEKGESGGGDNGSKKPSKKEQKKEL